MRKQRRLSKELVEKSRADSGLLCPLNLQKRSFIVKKDNSRSNSNTARTSKRSSRSQKNCLLLNHGDKLQGQLNYLILQQKMAKQKLQPSFKNLVRSNFQFQVVIGKGGFGRVWRVLFKKNKKLFAMKQMSKALIISKHSVPSVMNQKNLLQYLSNPFIVNMHFTFQDRDFLYLAMDLLTSGDLRTQLGRVRRFSQQQTKFFLACIILALQYLHGKGIIHRDIKPQNLIFDSKGYIRLTDMGVARVYAKQNASDTSGTPGYMAPQVLFRQNHSYQVDFFAVGVIGYQCMLGIRPYMGYSRKQIKDKVIAKQVQIKRGDIPQGWSVQSADFINKMIIRKASARLGSRGIAQVKAHPWFKTYNWAKLSSKMLTAPFMPYFRPQYCDQGQVTLEQGIIQLVQQNTMLLRQEKVQKLFQGYDFNRA